MDKNTFRFASLTSDQNVSTRTPTRVAWAKFVISLGAGYAPIVETVE